MTSKILRHRRGTAEQHTTFVGSEGEFTFNTTDKTIHAHDGVTRGGIPMATKNDLKALEDKLGDISFDTSSLAKVATTGAYSDLSGTPTALKNPTALTIQNSSGSSVASYDGSTATTVKLTSSTVGLGNVTNESKSTMFTNAALTGKPTAPTATAGTNTTQIATTAFVTNALSNVTPSNHTQASNTITALTGYTKANSASALSTTDSLNTALGKLEKALDGKLSTSGTAAKATADASGNTITSTYLTKTDASSTYLGKTATAAKATADASGNTITTTYAKKENSVYFIDGTGTEAGVWLGTHADIKSYYQGLTIAYKLGIAGVSGGSTLNINNLGAVAVVRNNGSAITTHYGVGTIIMLTYDVGSDTGTPYWKTADYDSDTKTRSSNKTGSKMYLIGATSQSTSGQTTYSNSGCYIGTDNLLYSGSKKVATEGDLRFYGSLIPIGTQITASETDTKDLNSVDYLKVGNYYCSQTAQAKFISNKPEDGAFMMQVIAPLTTTVDDETTSKWCYRIRRYTQYQGKDYIQYCNTSGTAGAWTYGPWRRILNDTNLTDIIQVSNTQPTNGVAEIWVDTSESMVGDSSKVNISGYRGILSGYSAPAASSSALSITNTSPDDTTAASAIAINVPNGTSGMVWTKTVAIMNASSTVTLGTNWSWNGGDVPKISAKSILILKWFDTFGIANLITVS